MNTDKEAAGANGGPERPLQVQAYQKSAKPGTTSRLVPASRVCRCPVCGRGEWCSVAADGSLCVCMRVEHGSVRRTRNGGFLHRLPDAAPARDARRRGMRSAWTRVGRPATRLADLAESYRRAVGPGDVEALAEALCVSAESLHRLGIGWAYDAGKCGQWDAGDVIRAGGRVWAFPMSDAAGRVTGIRLRTETGEKYSVKGSREGLFIPTGLPPGEPLLIAEGPTDTAALLDLGLAAVGRPSCTGGTTLLADLVSALGPPEVVVVADDDVPGRRGAEALAATLRGYAPSLRLIAPPSGIKDVRAWKRAGATTGDVVAAIHASPPKGLGVVGRNLSSRRRREARRAG